MKKLLLLICFAVLMFSCKKSKEVVNQDALTGAITGSIGPAGTVAMIYATNDLGKQFSANVDPTTGSFKLNDLAPGKYSLSLPNSAAYNPVTGLSIDIAGGKTIDIGVIGLSLNAPSGIFVSGYLLPVGFGTGVTATEQISGKTYMAVPTSIGFFMLTLPDGDYTLSFTAKPPVEAPQDIKVIVAGKPLNVGSINCKEGTSGSLTGKLSPANGASSIQATNTVTGDFVLGTINYTTGVFNFPVMFPGTYKISFAVNPPYLVPVVSNAVITTGKATDLGTIAFPYDNDIRVLSYKINGSSTVRYNQAGNFNGDTFGFSLSKITFSGGIPESMKTVNSTFTLLTGNVTGPGKYNLTGSYGSNITLTEITSSNSSITKVTTNWSISPTAPVGQLEVTAVDRAARTIRGTFSATLVADKPGVADKAITEGSFFLSY